MGKTAIFGGLVVGRFSLRLNDFQNFSSLCFALATAVVAAGVASIAADATAVAAAAAAAAATAAAAVAFAAAGASAASAAAVAFAESAPA